MAIISGNTGSGPLICSNVIWDRALGGSIWSEKGSSDLRSDAKSDANWIECKGSFRIIQRQPGT